MPSRSSISVSGRRGERPGFLATPQQPIDDGIEDGRVDIQDQVAFQRIRPQRVETGRVLQAEDKLAVSELVDTRQLHFYDCTGAGKSAALESLRVR